MSDHPRDRILEATRALLHRPDDPGDGAPNGAPTGATVGTRPVSVAQVAAAAHVSRATVYRYFADKTALLQAAGAGATNGAVPADPRARILEAALDVFGERGIHAATLAEIAGRAGLSLSGLHWHFKNKDELIAGIGESLPIAATLMAEALRAGSDDADLEAQLTHITTVALRFLARRRALVRLIIFETGIHPDVARLARQHTIGRFLPMLTAVFEQHAEHGSLRPGSSRARAQALLGMMVLLALLRPTFDDLLEPDDTASVREYVQIMLRGILADPTGPRQLPRREMCHDLPAPAPDRHGI
jgi:AcrR family transcriptional regulator